MYPSQAANNLIFLCSFIVYVFQISLPWSIASFISLGVLRVRWQIFGVYIAAVLYFAADLLGSYFHIPQIETYISFLCALLVVCSFITNTALPLFNLPKPSGQYSVGTRISSWYDVERERRLSVQMWYPSESKPTGKPVPFWWPSSSTMATTLCRLFGMPFFLLFHLDHCKSNAYFDLPIANQTLPVIIFCHGFYGFKSDRSYFSEQFASNGYIVLGVDHPGDCAMCVFPDGETIPFSAHLKPTDDEWTVRNAGIGARVKDIDFIIDRLKSISRGEDTLDTIEQTLRDRMDFNQIGCFGHSYGSATCVQFLLDGKNAETVKAVVGLDPWIFPLGNDVDNGVNNPLLFISSENWEPGVKTQAKRQKIIRNSNASSAGFVIRDTKHHNFDDLPFIVHPFIARKLGFIGGLPLIQCFTLTCEHSLSFFDTHVRSIKSSKQFHTSGVIFEEVRGEKTEIN